MKSWNLIVSFVSILYLSEGNIVTITITMAIVIMDWNIQQDLQLSKFSILSHNIAVFPQLLKGNSTILTH